MMRNMGGAVGLLLVAAGTLGVGVNALTHEDWCGDHVMQQSDLCPNHNQRSGSSWMNDYERQKARNQRLGIVFTGFTGVLVVAAGYVYVFTDPNGRRRRGDESDPAPGD